MLGRWLLVASLGALAGCGRWGFGVERTQEADASADAEADAVPDAADRPNRIFMTSTSYPATLGGLAGADAKCMARAQAGSLDGTWVAVLYTAATVPAARLTGSRGWVDLNGVVIADLPDSLENGTLNPLRYDEFRARIPTPAFAAQAWWGGHPPASGTCQDWTTTTLDTDSTLGIDGGASFTTDVYTACSNSERLICAEVGHVAAVHPPAETGRDVFVTVGNFGNLGGLAGADALCQGEAMGAGLTGTFLAYLPTAGATADSRFSTSGLPWRRVNGPRLAQTAAALLGPGSQDPWDTFIGAHADGTRTSIRVTIGTTTANCLSWTSVASGPASTIGASNATQRSRLNEFPNGCGGTGSPILCFEQ